MYSTLADEFLGAGVRPFEGFRPPDDMRAHYWYGSVFSMSHYDLAEILLTTVQDAWRDDAWVLEAGSFIGNSAVTWASTMRALQMRSVVVCIDTWLGDIIMWEKRGKMLGKPGADGQPRLFEQFMLNVAGKNMTEYVLPLRMPASIGLLYVRRHVEQQGLPPPAIIYVDTAHTYPETFFELEAAWALLRPGGFLTGDDFTHYYPPVQQALNEWVASKPNATFEPPALWASRWKGAQRNRLVRILEPGFESDPARSSVYAPYVLRLPGQWVLRKPPSEPPSAASGRREGEQLERRLKLIKRFEKRTNAVKPPLRCCLNGWADPLTVRCEASRDLRVHGNYTRKCTMPKPKPGEKFYTRCLPDRLMLQQDTCALPASRTYCVSKFACRSAVIAG